MKRVYASSMIGSVKILEQNEIKFITPDLKLFGAK